MSEAEARFARSADRSEARRILETARHKTLDHIWDRMVDLARPSTRLERGQGRSKLGGAPSADPDFEWPRDTQDRPLSFIAQIDLAEVHRVCKAEFLPSDGSLGFFYNTIDRPSGYHPRDRGSWAVFHWNAPSEAVSTPDEVEDIFHEVPLRAVGELTLPGIESIEIAKLELSQRELDAYEAILEQLGHVHPPRPVHRVVGWPDEIQSDPAIEAQLPSAGLDSTGPGVYDTAEAKHLLESAHIWRLVLQVDSDDAARMMWGDDGRLYFMMREPDLRSRAWDSAWLNSESS